MTRVMVDNNFTRMCRDGPAVSLNGSPTVSPTTAALCVGLPLPPYSHVSMNFLALSHAPPPLLSSVAMRMPAIVPTMRNDATVSAPTRNNTLKIRPTAIGALAYRLWLVRHLDDAAGIVGDGSERVHREDVRRGVQHAHRRHCGAEQPRVGEAARGTELVRGDDGGRDREGRQGRALERHR